MLRYPMHGFAKRVDDAVARAMSFLRAKGMDATIENPPASSPDIWQALARWKEPASVRWQLPSAARGIAVTSRRPRSFGAIVESRRDEGHQRMQRQSAVPNQDTTASMGIRRVQAKSASFGQHDGAVATVSPASRGGKSLMQ